jgi:hypothetical protein
MAMRVAGKDEGNGKGGMSNGGGNKESHVPQPQNHPKTNPVPPHTSPSIMVRWGSFNYQSCAHAQLEDK